MLAEAISFGFYDELQKIASRRGKSGRAKSEDAQPEGPQQSPQDPPQEPTQPQQPEYVPPEEPSLGSRIGSHFSDHWRKYLAGGAAAGLGYLGYKNWPAISRFGSAVKGYGSSLASKAGKTLAVGVPLGIAAYGLGRGLKSGERAKQLAEERDARMSAAAQGRYEPFRMEG